MPATLETATSKKAADGGAQRVELASRTALRQVKNEAETVRHSLAARRGGLITGGVVFVVVYGLLARRRRLERIEEKLDTVAGEVADGADF